jgi:tetratricopeptide (TPR) repeat protein
MTQDNAMFQEVLTALDNGNKTRARDLLTRLLKQEPNNPIYWVHMSAVVDTAKERSYCLHEALRLDPQNKSARRGLILMGEMPVDPSLVVPFSQQKRDWRKDFKTTSKVAVEAKGIVMKQSAWIVASVAGIAVLIVVSAILFNLFRPSAPTYVSLLGRTATGTITLTPGTGTIIPPEIEALAANLDVQYTPTTRYVNTPHPLLEAFTAGMRAYDRGEWENVITYMEQVLDAEPDAVDAQYYIGEAYRHMDQSNDAMEAYAAAIRMDNNFAPAYLGRAILQMNVNRNSDAENNVEEALRLDSNYLEAYLVMADLQLRLNDPSQARRYAEDALDILPESAWAHYYIAEALYAQDDLTGALEEAQVANSLDVTLLETYRLIGSLLQDLGRADNSVTPLLTYVTYEPYSAQALALLGNAYAAIGDTNAALDAFDRSLDLQNHYAVAFVGRGNLYLLMEDPASAIQDFQSAIRYTSRVFEPNLGIGRAYLLMGEYGNAYIQFNRAEGYAETDSELAQLYYWRAQSLEVLGGTNEITAAIHDWEALLDLPQSSVAEDIWQAAQEHLDALTGPEDTLTPTTSRTATRGSAATTRQSTPTRTRTPTRTPTP